MKKKICIIVLIILGIMFILGIKDLIDVSNQKKETQENEQPKQLTAKDYEDAGWEIEAEYTYNGDSENSTIKLTEDNQ